MGNVLKLERPKPSSYLNRNFNAQNERDFYSERSEYYAGLRDYLKEFCELMEEIEQYLRSRSHSQ